ncbi:MAG: GrpB family protein [Planctomycetota bacterium]
MVPDVPDIPETGPVPGEFQRKMETLEQKIARVVKEDVAVVPYDPRWPELFQQEKEHLLKCLPRDLVRRVEHFGSTAVPGLPAKPIVDILVEVADLGETRRRIAPLLEAQGYDYFWRPTWGDDTPPFYAWFIKRDQHQNRTHHIHMVEKHFDHWDRLLFRDYVIKRPEIAAEYAALKRELARAHPHDRVAYTKAKTDFITRITAEAKNSVERETGSG